VDDIKAVGWISPVTGAVSEGVFLLSDVAYLRTVFPDTTEEDFYTFFKQLNTSEVTVMAIKEGSVVFPKEPLIVICGPLAGLNNLIISVRYIM
jgi:nicotinic acid phosphoribosyltransferase